MEEVSGFLLFTEELASLKKKKNHGTETNIINLHCEQKLAFTQSASLVSGASPRFLASKSLSPNSSLPSYNTCFLPSLHNGPSLISKSHLFFHPALYLFVLSFLFSFLGAPIIALSQVHCCSVFFISHNFFSLNTCFLSVPPQIP